jgi:hypothetical protein
MLWLLPVCLLVPVLVFIANKVMQFTEAVSIALSNILQALINLSIIAVIIAVIFFLFVFLFRD